MKDDGVGRGPGRIQLPGFTAGAGANVAQLVAAAEMN